MASTSETGHAINVANFEDLISYATGYGIKYNPSKAALKLPALTVMLGNAQTVSSTLTAAETVFNKATNARKDTFKPLKPLCTKIVNALASTDATANTIADARGYNKKIQGASDKSEPKQPTSGTADSAQSPTPKQISTSQQSYDRLVDHFSKLLELLKNEASYIPNETELKVATLALLLSALKGANTAVINAETPFTNARTNRNVVLYARATGLVDIVLAVKRYVKSVFGASSPQFKQVAALKFTRGK